MSVVQSTNPLPSPPRAPYSDHTPTEPDSELDPLSKEHALACRSPRIAILDRDSGFVRVLSNRLDNVNWEHRILSGAPSPETIASMRLSALEVDLAILGEQAWTWLERLCRLLPELGVVVCTGPVSVNTRIRGLRLGADDWVSKPCHAEEIIARLESVTRRQLREARRIHAKPLIAGELEIRPNRLQAFVGGESLNLTRREFEVIALLASAEGSVVERKEIYVRLWGYEMVRGDRSVDVFIRKLRAKLEEASPAWQYIHTHFGVGYRFAATPIATVS